MSVLTFSTAPWAVGTIYRIIGRIEPVNRLFVAANAWLFSASWSYDGYLVLRDGRYPSTWLYNLMASSVLFILAGLFWNLEWVPERGVIFAFMQRKWPSAPSPSSFARIAAMAAIFIVMVSAMVGYFLLDSARMFSR